MHQPPPSDDEQRALRSGGASGCDATHVAPVLVSRSAVIAGAICAVSIASGCSSDARLAVAAQPMTAELNAATIRYRVEAGVRNWTVDLQPVAAGTSAGRRNGPAFDTPQKGTATVTFSVILPDGRAIATGQASVPLRGDWEWDFELMALTDDPKPTCFGCFGSKSFALPADLRSAGRDSLWLVWGGNSIRDPVVY